MICGELTKTKNSDCRSTNLNFNMQVQSVFKCNYVSIILQSGFTRYQLVFKGFTLTLSMPIGELSLFGSEIKLASPINNP